MDIYKLFAKCDFKKNRHSDDNKYIDIMVNKLIIKIHFFFEFLKQ